MQAHRAGKPDGSLASEVQKTDDCIPNCPRCGGTGWLRRDLPVCDPDFGKAVDCPNKPHTKRYGEAQCGLEADDTRQLSWDKVLRVNDAGEALDRVRTVVERGHGWVYLWGRYGTCKTRLLKIAVVESLRVRKSGYYIRMVDLLDELRLAYDDNNQNQEIAARVRRYTDIPLLALDEVDRFKETDWTRERVFQLIDGRYSAAEAKRSITLFASNKSPDQLDGYFASRICDARFAVVHLDGRDLRGGMKRVG